MATRKSGTTRSSKKKPAKSSKSATPTKSTEELLALADFTESAYLHYSMYVILDRALPHIGDGLKPVQRRIIYAMSDLGLHANSKHKKSARTVGDVLGKFHPHGDSACYEAMVLMAQPFSYRYPLIDGQGNWGSTDDPKSFAAMRYTEARMTRYAQVLLSELGQGTVDWMPNFDGTLNEPRTLPARLPNVLLNGGSGIAVGMATDIPPHNIREVAAAVIHMIDSPKATVKDLMKHIQGPDYPTDAEIISSPAEIRQMYESGNGSIRMRAVWRKESGDVVITALPHQVSGSKILEQIASQMNNKKLPLVQDLRDESDHENPVRLVIEPRSNRVDVEELMNHLFATTDLERSYRVNLNMIGLNGRPRVFNLKELLKEWIEYRMGTVTRRLQHRLDRVLDRLHILDGYLIAYLNIDEVIKIIRNEDEPKPVLMKRFKLSERQAEAILELKLRHLAKLEEMRIQGEKDELAVERDALEKILKSKARLKTLVKKEITADAEEFGDARRSPIAEREAAKALDQSALIPAEPTTVVLSKLGWIRAAKGHEVNPTEMNYRQGDGYLHSVRGRTNQTLICLDSTGRAYGLAAHSLPSARSLGEPVSSGLKPPAGATFNGVMMGTEDTRYLLSTNQGYGFIARLGDMITKTKAGKAVIRAGGAVETLTPAPISSIEDGWVAVVTNAGRLLVFELSELPELGKGKGVKLFNVPKKDFESGDEKVVGVAVFEEGDHVLVHAGKRVLTLKPKDIDGYVGERARRGLMLPKGYRQVIRIETKAKE